MPMTWCPRPQSPCWPEGLRVDAEAGWTYYFQSVEEMERAAGAIVLATVVDITDGRMVQPTPSHTQIEHTNVHFRID